jgi:hypothetical protein
MGKFQLCLILDNAKDILPITGTKTKSSQKVGVAGRGDTIPH